MQFVLEFVVTCSDETNIVMMAKTRIRQGRKFQGLGSKSLLLACATRNAGSTAFAYSAISDFLCERYH